MSDEISLAMQKALRGRLVATAAVTALVPATSILDRNARPETFPCILVGEDQVVDAEVDIKRSVVHVFSTLHLWQREESLAGVKQIANAVRRALRDRLDVASDYHVADSFVRETRFVRDPDGEHSHGIMTVESLVQETWITA